MFRLAFSGVAGDLERWEDETHLMGFLKHALPESCTLLSLKIVRDCQTNYHLGYGFLDFGSQSAASEAIEILRRTSRPGHNRCGFRLAKF